MKALTLLKNKRPVLLPHTKGIASIRGGWALGVVKNVLFFLFFLLLLLLFFLFLSFFFLSLNQAKYHQHMLFLPLCARPVKPTIFPLFFETFQLVSIDKKMMLNRFPLLSRNTVGSQFIQVLDSFLLPKLLVIFCLIEG